MADILLSVPSSLGNYLQLKISLIITRVPKSFSPLFIGELPATKEQICGEQIYQSFQSPLHWGITCNRAETGVVLEDFLTFSPLFIGELPATKERTNEYLNYFYFQSPLHWGITCNKFFN